MKKYIAILILTFMVGSLLVGCVDAPNGSQNGGSEIGGNTEGGSSPSIGNGSGTTENESVPNGDTPVEGGTDDGSENGGNTEGGESGSVGGNSGDGESGSVGGNSGEENPPEDTPLPEVGSEVGKLFKTISLETLDGGRVSPDDYRGKIVIVNIWATWCPPCKAELPDFDQIAKDYADEVVIIAAHDYNGRANAPSYVETNFPDTNIIFAYDGYYADAYFAAGGDGYVPYTAILDQRGVIVYSASGILTYEYLQATIEDLLSK